MVCEDTVHVANEVREELEEHGVQVEDALAALSFGESTGVKFERKGSPGRFLARVRLGRINAYAQYRVVGDGAYELLAAYVHRASFLSDVTQRKGASCGGESQWTCCQCGVDVESVEDVALCYLIDGEDPDDFPVPDQPGLRCPVCKRELLQRRLVYDLLENAERMLEAK